MKSTENSEPSDAPSRGRDLACQILDNLRRGASAPFELDADSEEEAVATAEKTRTFIRLPADKAAYAIALGYALARYFPTIEDLATTKAFAVIRCRVGDDAERLGEVLVEALPHEPGEIAYNPQYALRGKERFVVIADAGVRYTNRAVRAIAQAAERCLPVFCTLSVDDPVPSAIAGADLLLDLPPVTPEMLALLFDAAHDEVPADTLNFASSEKLRIEDIIAHIRRGRPATECLSALQQVVKPASSTAKPQTIRLQDLAGYGEAKTWGLELAADMELWRQGKLNWDEVDHRAIVLAGAPGTGKTSFATVLAGTLEVPLIASNVAEWNAHKNLSGTLGRMKEVFAEAIAKAPCVLLIDEIDGISSRSALAGDYVEYWSQIVNLMLVLVTEAVGTPGVVIVGATNYVARIDPALMRAGRLDRTIHIELPDESAILVILDTYLAGALPKAGLSRVASRLVGRTGADIEKLVRSAKAAARRARAPLSLRHLEGQLADPLAGLSPPTRRRVAIYRNGQRIVAQALGLADLRAETDVQSLRQLLTKGLSDQRYPTEQLCDDVLAVIVAGRAAEEIVFGDVSTFGSSGAYSDLAAATLIAKTMELQAGFGEIGLIYIDDVDHVPASSWASVRRRLDDALARASALLLENRDELERSWEINQRSHLTLLN